MRSEVPHAYPFGGLVGIPTNFTLANEQQNPSSSMPKHIGHCGHTPLQHARRRRSQPHVAKVPLLWEYRILTARTVNSFRSEVREQVKDAAPKGSLNLLLLTDRDVAFLLSIGVSCRRSWRDGSHDRLKAEHLERMKRIRVELADLL